VNKYVYMANFSLLNAAGTTALGGVLYGGGSSATKLLNPKEELSEEQIKQELLANAAGGAVSGAGLYGISKLSNLRNAVK